jgi:hypothetical protein
MALCSSDEAALGRDNSLSKDCWSCVFDILTPESKIHLSMTCKYIQRVFDEYQKRKWKSFGETPQFVIKNFNLNVFMYEYIPKSAFETVGFNFFYKNNIYKLEQILTKEKLNYGSLGGQAKEDIKMIEIQFHAFLLKHIVYSYIQHRGDIINTIMELE